ncbi:MAG: F0F1 ATP synthase subunit B [Candidatus Pacebacteria bacterium]|nr:F0F1 ATP synthase subunit B [Candidatus Paceibacterota bacterium]MDD4333873.1 F0F1 ATP synthase subunit B [Candidatus Paceibacterota bacterium]
MEEGTNLIITFVGQLLNFTILFFLLSKFVFKPLFKMLEERRQKIQEGVLKEEKAEEKLNNLRELDKKLKIKNEEDRKKVLLEAQEEADKRKEKTLEELNQTKKDLLLKAEKEVADLKVKEMEKSKREIVENSISLAEKILKGNIDEKANGEIINNYLNSLNEKR